MSLKMKWIFGILTLFFIVLGLGLSVFFMPDRFIQATKQSEIDRIMRSKGYLKEDTVIVFYQPNCADCRKVGLNILLQESANRSSKFLNIDTQKFNNRKYLNEFYITNTPTIVRFNHGNERIYSGTSKTEINRIMRKNIIIDKHGEVNIND